jgi:hypothetical protein
VRRHPTSLLAVEISAAILFVLLAAGMLWSGDQDGELVPLDGAALATGPSLERWYGFFLQDQHVGYSVTRSSPVSGGGTLFEERSSFRIVTFGKINEVVTASAALVDPAGALLRFDSFMASGDTRISARAKVEGSHISMEVTQAGETNTVDFATSAPPQVSLSLEAVLRRTALTPGLRFSVPYFDPLILKEDQMEIRVDDLVILDNGEEAYWLSTSHGGTTTRALVTPTGEALREETPLGLSLVRMTPEDARDIPTSAEPTDLIGLSAVQLEGRLKGARERHRLTLRIKGVEPSRVWSAPPLQTITDDIVRIKIPALDELPTLPVRDDSDPQWLVSTLTLPASHPELRIRAAEVIGDATDRLTAVRRLVDFVYRYVEKVPTLGVPNGLEVLREARGDCNEHTALFVSLARAAGIPARIAAGVVWSDRMGNQPAFYYHAWPEVRLGGPTDWVPVDPTFGQLPADATHVKLVEGDLDRQVEIMAVMGRLGFALVEEP